ncbi:hypothetical protein EDL99_05235 [Ornithobacterium rhinotracheale]|uniref:hypothetical protein n=1 Tax=Ornithobacterium rhinotracheale TaxID=28251 RepID=UPI00129C6D67|nr:hypothetical protein [Ornithobacterium rhinotracheale]MRJ08285.1 hypothetical protein [Ornithobacterium rhinotracheale]UOH77480.1 hypothetical protein MT996_09720 [Ornithobacterium rhinotracheale]
MQKYKESFSALENAIYAMIRKNKELQEDNAELSRQNEQLKLKLNEEWAKNQELVHINENLKIASALGGNPEHKKLMKLKINRLIKEVDLCMAEVNKKSL